MSAEGMIQKLPLEIQGHMIEVPVFLLPIAGADVILGASWLATLGPHVADYASLTLKFFLKDKFVTLSEGSSPVKVKPYRYPHSQKEQIEIMIQEMLQQGIIHNSTSPFSSPIILVKKKDGTWRFCTDYRALNAITVKDCFPIPTVDELLDELH
ncbi:hypothetical protein A2U01_0014798, partial [Trifolium medium]|nr:hypothetical protein [Trifolium medium]